MFELETMGVPMKKIYSVLLIVVLGSCLSHQPVYSETLTMENEELIELLSGIGEDTEGIVSGTIMEYVSGGAVIQVGDQNYSLPALVFVTDESGALVEGSLEDLKVYQMVKLVLGEDGEDGLVAIDALVILEDASSGTGDSLDDSKDGVTGSPESEQTEIRLENGVWVN